MRNGPPQILGLFTVMPPVALARAIEQILFPLGQHLLVSLRAILGSILFLPSGFQAPRLFFVAQQRIFFEV
jgi:hypothetical protein